MALGTTFGRVTTTYNGGSKVWHEVKAQYPVGGLVDVSSYSEGDIVKAGSIFALDMVNHVAAPAVVYSTSTTYTVGAYCYYDGVIYKCKASCLAAAWSTNKSNFTAVNGGFGLLQDDLVIDEFAKASNGAATVSLVYQGVIYASRTSLTATELALVPGVTPIYEK